MSASRPEVVGRLVEWLTRIDLARPVRVAIDGPDAAGKTTLAAEIAEALGSRALRISADDFHRPAQERLRRGPLSAEGYFMDAFDVPALRREVLEPLGPQGNRQYRTAVWDHLTNTSRSDPRRVAARDAIVLVDGVFLLREELRDCWDVRIFVEVREDEQLRRAVERDTEIFGTAERVRERYAVRYRPAHELYWNSARPTEQADIVIDNTDPGGPVIRRWTGNRAG
ncbi:AAA family ATPase [Allokutzneria sp. A3M-2-11 16]|uniref:AAA family ATPase n=1 Tax=Allokutzneria sp. A3M-2-11 16 TaxID=2962043 RepID=UPI0020B76C18|nr:AAA family ATPase [Allokutzneria sp. A3M-2-11 16]MCP3799408.1 AAA family ATPase [Allokutzneria sp. A3M-2-11 16]